MCGLFISVGFPPDPSRIDIVAHRGPDGRGWREFMSPAGPVCLGHRRLSIIDLDARADQPMASADGRHWLVFNGEIYNYIELQRELGEKGVRLRTESDSEALLESWRLWGPAALDRFLGMFAFAIWDDRDKLLYLARDRFGIKPLVYHASIAGAAFASETKQLLDLPGFRRRMDLARAHDFLSAGVTDHAAQSMFAEVRNIGPGRVAVLDLNRWRPGDEIAVRSYWAPPRPSDAPVPEAEAAEQFRALFLDSVRLHMRADVRVGSCLSGGLDSSSIVCAHAKLSNGALGFARLNAVSAIFPNSNVDESCFIDEVVKHTGVAANRVSVGPESVLSEAETIVCAQDEPYGSTSIHAQWRVFEAARGLGLKVMLDGQGADEILGGYHGCFFFHYRRLLQQFRLRELGQTLRERKAWHGISYRAQLAPFSARLPFRRRGGPLPLPWLEGIDMKPYAARAERLMAEALAAENLGQIRSLGDYCLVLTRTLNLPMLLRYEDRSSMAHSVEARVPFLDHRLVEYALRLGNQHKIVGGDTKRVLRMAMKGILPERILIRRDKLGFSTPEETWFKGSLKGPILAAVEDALALYPGLFHVDSARRHAREMLEGVRPFDFSLWRIAIFGIWGRALGMSY